VGSASGTDGRASAVIDRLLHAARPVSRSTGVLLGVLIVGVTVAIDYALGPDIQFSVFYAFGPIVTAWCATRRDGILVAVLAALTSVALHLLNGELAAEPLPLLLSLLIRLGSLTLIAVLVAQVRALTERLETLSMRDSLTGLLNRRALLERLDEEIARARRKATPLSLVYADVDWFKSVNDRFGHSVGDEFLVLVADALSQSLRPTDIAARMGGDEFVVLLPETDAAGTARIAERLAEQLDPLETRYGAGLSLGFSSFATPPDSAESAINTADSAMYDAKRARKAGADGPPAAIAPAR
jgi:diguanylate cyclase (GGDEF)-like protein